LPEEFIRGESAVTQLDGGGGGGEVEGPGRRLEVDVEWRWGTRRSRGGLLWSGAAESREKRGLTFARSSWSCPPPELEDEECEKREEASERDASESELSRRSGADARSDAAPLDARPPLLRWSRNLRDLAAEELVVFVLPGVFANAADGDGDGDDDALGLWAEAAARLSPSSSRHRLEQLGALGENTYWSAAPAAAPPRIAFIGSGVAGIASNNLGGGAAAAVSGSGAAEAAAAASF
jgi:hypothetical protein